MRKTAVAILIGALASLALSAGFNDVAPAADTCLTSPKGAAPEGSHWYYRIDHASKRHCWYLRARGEKPLPRLTSRPSETPIPMPAPAVARAEARPFENISQPNAAAESFAPADHHETRQETRALPERSQKKGTTMIYVVAMLAAILVGFWILRPAYLRWRDYLQHAPELQDAPFGTKALVLFKGLRTKMLARFMDGLGVALPLINAVGEWIQPGGGIDLSSVLPSIPLPWGAGAVLTAGQYSPIVFLVLGRLTDYLRNHTTTPPNTIDPALAVKVAGESNNVQGDTPSPSLAAIIDPRAPVPTDVGAAIPEPLRRRRAAAKRPRKVARRKPAKKRAA
jgi:hypothetical protein